jgi:isopentenyl-diphosphate delta-isomerase type 1
MEPLNELLDIVNENNEVIGQGTRGEAHKKGHIHRSLSVLILNSRGQILLQQRSDKSKVHPLSWDLSTSEHVLSGESYIDAGKRSLKEELGIEAEIEIVTNEVLQKREYQINGEKHFEYEIVLMLKGVHEGPFNIDPSEVHKVKFFSLEEVEKMKNDGIKFTPWFLDEWENVKRVLGS